LYNTIEPFSSYFYPTLDSCDQIVYPTTKESRWFNPKGTTWNTQHPTYRFTVCNVKQTQDEIPDIACSMCNSCGLLIDNQHTKHCVEANPTTQLPKDENLRSLYLQNKDYYTWIYKNKIYSTYKPATIYIS
jgi:hypothetical protein